MGGEACLKLGVIIEVKIKVLTRGISNANVNVRDRGWNHDPGKNSNQTNEVNKNYRFTFPSNQSKEKKEFRIRFSTSYLRMNEYLP